MNTLTRISIVIAAVFVVGGVAMSFTSVTLESGTNCGSWVSPHYDDETLAEVAEGFAFSDFLSEQAEERGDDTSDLDMANAALLAEIEDCDDALSSRRILSLALLVMAIVGPGVLFFIRGGRKLDDGGSPSGI